MNDEKQIGYESYMDKNFDLSRQKLSPYFDEDIVERENVCPEDGNPDSDFWMVSEKPKEKKIMKKILLVVVMLWGCTNCFALAPKSELEPQKQIRVRPTPLEISKTKTFFKPFSKREKKFGNINEMISQMQGSLEIAYSDGVWGELWSPTLKHYNGNDVTIEKRNLEKSKLIEKIPNLNKMYEKINENFPKLIEEMKDIFPSSIRGQEGIRISFVQGLSSVFVFDVDSLILKLNPDFFIVKNNISVYVLLQSLIEIDYVLNHNCKNLVVSYLETTKDENCNQLKKEYNQLPEHQKVMLDIIGLTFTENQA